MSESEYDDTDMSPEEFEERMAATVPADLDSTAIPFGRFVQPTANVGGGTSQVIRLPLGVPLATVASTGRELTPSE